MRNTGRYVPWTTMIHVVRYSFSTVQYTVLSTVLYTCTLLIESRRMMVLREESQKTLVLQLKRKASQRMLATSSSFDSVVRSTDILDLPDEYWRKLLTSIPTLTLPLEDYNHQSLQYKTSWNYIIESNKSCLEVKSMNYLMFVTVITWEIILSVLRKHKN